MKHIIEYKLHKPHIPYFVDDGGYWMLEGKLVGISKDDTECYIPETVIKLAPKELIERVRSILKTDELGEKYTTENKDKIAKIWLKERGFDV